LTLRDFFVDFLLKRGPRETFGRRYDNLKTIEWRSGIFSDEKRILSTLAQVPLERRKEIRALSTFTALWETFTQANKETQVARDAIQELFYSKPVFQWCRKHAPSPLPAYVRHPAGLVNDFLKLYDKWVSKPPMATPRFEMLYAFLTRDLSFEAFRKSMPQMQSLDRELSELFERNGDPLCRDLFPVVGAEPGQWNKNQWLRERVDMLKSRAEFFERLRFAAADSAPIHKLREFGRAFGMVRKYFVVNFPPSKDLGEDELLPAQIAFVILANPPALVSNLAFICEFCTSSKYDRVFHQTLVQPLSVLRMVCKYLSDAQILVDMGYIPPQDM
jgi:hypothetical protein